MIEQYLQVAIEFIKEIWFQLNTMFGLEDTQAFKFSNLISSSSENDLYGNRIAL
ncbi:MAG: hypothetical protein CM1200mP16_12270 [Nitrospina sp.]|nr:MAG: hypothetical protein CM1200mP16_12270 [Nitrospina sp.]